MTGDLEGMPEKILVCESKGLGAKE